ncbi:MAG TPA: YbhN family protein, partial [Candidatus Polarisedimenticolia bacterium]|nr:YbhN family protein [Candidatus Polarisedimenticolia bacterium]
MPSHLSVRRWLRLGLGLAVGGVALWALHRALGEYRYQDVIQGLRAVPGESLLLSFGLVALGYLILGGYDRLASRYAGRPLERGRSHLVAFLAYAVGNNTGFANLGTSSIRLRLYAQWGYSGLEIGSIIAFCGLTFWLGYLTLGGFVFLFTPPPLPAGLGLSFGSTQLLGALFLTLVAGYLTACLLRHAPIRWRAFEFASPGRLAVPQV